MSVFDLIIECARIPSFSSYEDRLHPFIEDVVRQVPNAQLERVLDNNLVIDVSSSRKAPIIALAAHLDKINHFGDTEQTILQVQKGEHEIFGQLDNAVGVGICLQLLLESRKHEFPPLYILFSEMEESFGLRRHPHLLRQGAEGLSPQIGAARIANHLLRDKRIPSSVITIDTTPLFHGLEGIALYSRHWEKNGLSPSCELIAKTEQLETYFRGLNPSLRLYNNVNDYLMYGKLFNSEYVVPCIALEPAIYPYHTVGERVFCSDVEGVTKMLEVFLEAETVN